MASLYTEELVVVVVEMVAVVAVLVVDMVLVVLVVVVGLTKPLVHNIVVGQHI